MADILSAFISRVKPPNHPDGQQPDENLESEIQNL